MSKHFDDLDWSSLHDKVEEMLGTHFWNDFTTLLPKKFPAIDLYETEKEGIIVAELPGLQSAKDVEIKVELNTLTIQGQLPYSYEVAKPHLKINERHTGVFMRTIKLPFQFVENEIKAKYRNGLLEIKLLKQEVNQQIAIEFNEE
ncbi:heat-shock protein [Priestia aryabhattai]|uniref:Hsp20/alpha crystallin family protein n=1 Tax=Bacillaceae TaxID=186817 RepID=UPI000BA080B2|nr:MULTISPECIES: Hsp20/alpha crystallin family protein [Bacillaceae]OZT14210.1 heat-shock protein [Priestia aryabhattai]TDB54978.1 Hsp20/alpha crystallin family protein [Bacillus sp. CBEL-1]